MLNIQVIELSIYLECIGHSTLKAKGVLALDTLNNFVANDNITNQLTKV